MTDDQGPGQSFESVLDGSTVYMRSPTYRLPAGKEWIQVAPAAATALGLERGGLMMVDALQAVGKDVQKIGPVRIHGAEANHYRTNPPFRRLFGPTATGPAGSILRFPRHGLPRTGPARCRRYDVDVWVGGDGLIRQIRIAVAGGEGHFTTTITLSDFGNR